MHKCKCPRAHKWNVPASKKCFFKVEMGFALGWFLSHTAAAKSLQSCPSLCDPIDGLLPGSPCPWDSPGKNTGVGCHFLLQCMKLKSESEVAQLCPTLFDPIDCSPPGSSIHGIFQARVLEWAAIAFSMGKLSLKIILFIEKLLAELGLHCCSQAVSRCGGHEPPFLAVPGLLTVAASLVVEHRLWCTGSVAVACGLSCSLTCGIFLDQGSNPYPPHWQADSYSLYHQKSWGNQLLAYTSEPSIFLVNKYWTWWS